MKAVVVSSVLSSYSGYEYITADEDKHGNKSVTIHLKKNDLYKKIHEAWLTSSMITISTLVGYAENRFLNKFGRNIIFNSSCLYMEIKDHVEAYFWTKGLLNKGVGYTCCPATIYGGALLLQRTEKHKNDTIKQIVEECTVDTDIREKDVFNDQALAFGYYYGIRNEFKNTKLDPYKGISFTTFTKKCVKKWF